jgi:hypothetical protein
MPPSNTPTTLHIPFTAYVLQNAVAEHKATWSEDYARDFIDVYLKEIKKQEGIQEPSTFSGESHCSALSKTHISTLDI